MSDYQTQDWGALTGQVVTDILGRQALPANLQILGNCFPINLLILQKHGQKWCIDIWPQPLVF